MSSMRCSSVRTSSDSSDCWASESAAKNGRCIPSMIESTRRRLHRSRCNEAPQGADLWSQAEASQAHCPSLGWRELSDWLVRPHALKQTKGQE